MGRVGGEGQTPDRSTLRRRGFTLTEMLAALGILVALMAVAFPAVGSVQRSLRQMQLDATAQQIYNATQSRLTALKAAGELGNLSTLVDKDTSSIKPADYPSTVASYDATSDDADVRYVIYSASISDDSANAKAVNNYLFTDQSSRISRGLTSGGTFVVELSPTTGEVYGVFYWETAGGNAAKEVGGTNPSSAADFYQALCSQVRTADASTFKANRASCNVGYYGGKPVTKPSTESNAKDHDIKFDDLTLEVVNKEELYASIKSADFAKLAGDSELLDRLTITLSIKGVSSASGSGWGQDYTYSETYKGSDLGLGAGTNEWDRIIDSMRDGLCFRNQYPNIVPGADVTVTMALSYEPIGGDPFTKEASTTVNSLFASRTTCSDDSGTGTQVTVSCLRHLRNLGLQLDYGGRNIDSTRAKTAATNDQQVAANYAYNFARYDRVVIDNDIDFDGTTWADDSVSIQSRTIDNGNGKNPLGTTMKPIMAYYQLIAQTGCTVSGKKADGTNAVLKNFHIVADTSNPETRGTGLFDYSSMKLANLTMVNPIIDGGSTANVGALAGESMGQYADCDIYSTDDHTTSQVVSTGDFVGGLVGRVSGNLSGGTVNGCSVALNVSGNNYVGGIYGGAKQADGTAAYATVSKSLVGDVTKAQRLVVITGTGTCVGGISGDCNAPLTEDKVFAVVTGSSYVGGIAGSMGSGAQGSYGNEMGNADSGKGKVKAAVTGSGDCVGGLYGVLWASVGDNSKAQSKAACDVTGGSKVGGLVGSLESGSITNCAALSFDDASNGLPGGKATDIRLGLYKVTGNGYYVGGAIGQQKGAAYNCTAEMQVDGVYYVGGFVGYCESGNASNNSVHGPVSGNGHAALANVVGHERCVGGYAGYIKSSDISSCSSAAMVSYSPTTMGKTDNGNPYGGFIGMIDAGRVTNCCSSGNVAADYYVGGFIGYCRSGVYLTNDFTTTRVDGHSASRYDKGHNGKAGCLGGFIGYDENTGWLANCVSYGKIKFDATTDASNNPRFADLTTINGFVGYSPRAANQYASTTFFLSDAKLGEDGKPVYDADLQMPLEFNYNFGYYKGYSPWAQPGTRTFETAKDGASGEATYPEKCSGIFPYYRAGVSIPFYGDWATGVDSK